MLKKLAFFLTLVSLSSCGGGDPAPRATILDTSPEEIHPDRDEADDVTILLEYRDRDGDLGEGVAEVYDCRAEGLTIELPIPPIANMEAVERGVSIEGELELVVSDVGDLPADDAAPPTCRELGAADPAEGEVVFCVVLVDAAGNVGEGDCTSSIRVLSPASRRRAAAGGSQDPSSASSRLPRRVEAAKTAASSQSPRREERTPRRRWRRVRR